MATLTHSFPNADESAYPRDPHGLTTGLTKREYIATATLQGLLASGCATGKLAAFAVNMADDLLEALDNDPGKATK